MRPILFLAVLLLTVASALAQSGDRCGRLQAELDTLGRSAPVDETRVEQYRDAIDRQTDELDRTRDYARSIGCDFETGGQCSSLVSNLRRMQRNLAVLENQYQRLQASAGDQRDTERQRVETTMADLGCNGAAPGGGQRSAGFYEQLFGPDETDPGYALPPSSGEPVQPDAATAEPQPAGGNLRTHLRAQMRRLLLPDQLLDQCGELSRRCRGLPPAMPDGRGRALLLRHLLAAAGRCPRP